MSADDATTTAEPEPESAEQAEPAELEEPDDLAAHVAELEETLEEKDEAVRWMLEKWREEMEARMEAERRADRGVERLRTEIRLQHDPELQEWPPLFDAFDADEWRGS